jgi:hypothetical protein
MAEYTCCSSVAFERPNENTFTFTPPPPPNAVPFQTCVLQAPLLGYVPDVIETLGAQLCAPTLLREGLMVLSQMSLLEGALVRGLLGAAQRGSCMHTRPLEYRDLPRCAQTPLLEALPVLLQVLSAHPADLDLHPVAFVFLHNVGVGLDDDSTVRDAFRGGGGVGAGQAGTGSMFILPAIGGGGGVAVRVVCQCACVRGSTAPTTSSGHARGGGWERVSLELRFATQAATVPRGLDRVTGLDPASAPPAHVNSFSVVVA